LVLVLTGCASTPAEPTNPNFKPCLDFEEAATNLIMSFTPEGNGLSFEVELRNIESASRDAEGDVKDAMNRAADLMPSAGDQMMNSEDRSRASSLIQAVANACEAEGVGISPTTWVN
jgi:hypothetical protein